MLWKKRDHSNAGLLPAGLYHTGTWYRPSSGLLAGTTAVLAAQSETSGNPRRNSENVEHAAGVTSHYYLLHHIAASTTIGLVGLNSWRF